MLPPEMMNIYFFNFCINYCLMGFSYSLLAIALDEHFAWSVKDKRIFYKNMRKSGPIVIVLGIIFSTTFSECPGMSFKDGIVIG